jgi:chemotaxis protein methyltransferase CheR
VSEIDDLVALIERATGNVIPERDHRFLEATARARMKALSCSDLTEYLGFLKGADDSEWRRLLNLVTVKESYLFRGSQQLEALTTRVVPTLLRRRDERHLRVWSAGCARGEEPATLAITLMEMPALATRRWRILATDVDEAALDDARRGVFGARAMERVPRDLVSKYFTFETDGTHRLRAEVQSHVEYRRVNLVDEPLDLGESDFDVILMRNVLIYFRPEAQRRVVAAVARHLADDGVLFVGLSETLWTLHPELQAIDLGCCFGYGRTAAALGFDAFSQRPKSDAECASSARSVPDPTVSTRQSTRDASSRDTGSHFLGPGRRTRHRAHLLVVEALVENAPSRARSMASEGLELYPEDAVLRAFEALAAEMLDDHAGAIRACRAALYLNPGLYQTRLVLARNMAHLGWLRRSAQEYRRVLEDLANDEVAELERWQEITLPSRVETRELCLQALEELNE